MSSTLVNEYPPIDISPVKKYNQFQRRREIEIQEKNITQLQIIEISRLSGTIQTIYNLVSTAYINEYHKTDENSRHVFPFAVPADQSDEILRLENELLLKKKISLLQDFLTRELEYSEKLEKETKQLQYQLNQSNLKTYRQKRNKSQTKPPDSTRVTSIATSITIDAIVPQPESSSSNIELYEVRPPSPSLSDENNNAEYVGDYILKVRERFVFLQTPYKYNIFLDLLAQFEKSEDVDKIVEDIWQIFDDQVDLMMDFYNIIIDPSLPRVLRTLSLEKIPEEATISSSSQPNQMESLQIIQSSITNEPQQVIQSSITNEPQQVIQSSVATNEDNITPLPIRKRQREPNSDLASSDDEDALDSSERSNRNQQEQYYGDDDNNNIPFHYQDNSQSEVEDEMIEDHFIDEDELLQHQPSSSSSSSKPAAAAVAGSNPYYERLTESEQRRRRDEERQERKRRRSEVIEKNKEKEMEEKTKQKLKHQEKQLEKQLGKQREKQLEKLQEKQLEKQQGKQQERQKANNSPQNKPQNSPPNNHINQKPPAHKTKAEKKQETRNLIASMEEKYVGKFVSREFQEGLFYGVIKNYHHPFFRIVYEDGDMEDVNRNTLEEAGLLCSEKDIPKLRKESCLVEAVKAQEKQEQKQQKKRNRKMSRNQRRQQQQQQRQQQPQIEQEEPEYFSFSDSLQNNEMMLDSDPDFPHRRPLSRQQEKDEEESGDNDDDDAQQQEEEEEEDELIIIRRKREDNRPRLDSVDEEKEEDQAVATTSEVVEIDEMIVETHVVEMEVVEEGEQVEELEEIVKEIPFNYPENIVDEENKAMGSPIPFHSSQSSHHSSPPISFLTSTNLASITAESNPLPSIPHDNPSPSDTSSASQNSNHEEAQTDPSTSMDLAIPAEATTLEVKEEMLPEYFHSQRKSSEDGEDEDCEDADDDDEDDNDDEIEVIENYSPSKTVVCIDLSLGE